MTKQTRDYVDIGLAVESILDAYGNPAVVSLTIDPWRIALHTEEHLPGVEYESTTVDNFIIDRGEIQHGDLVFQVVHVERGKVVPA